MNILDIWIVKTDNIFISYFNACNYNIFKNINKFIKFTEAFPLSFFNNFKPLRKLINLLDPGFEKPTCYRSIVLYN